MNEIHGVGVSEVDKLVFFGYFIDDGVISNNNR